jgi:hypothetical protein
VKQQNTEKHKKHYATLDLKGLAFSLDFTGLGWQPIIIFCTSFVLDNISFVGETVKPT